jgi:serine/threonine protein kinase
VYPKFPGVTLVLAFMPCNLARVIKRAKKSGERMPEAHVKSYMQMLLQGVAHMHLNRVMHRV